MQKMPAESQCAHRQALVFEAFTLGGGTVSNSQQAILVLLLQCCGGNPNCFVVLRVTEHFERLLHQHNHTRGQVVKTASADITHQNLRPQDLNDIEKAFFHGFVRMVWACALRSPACLEA